MIQDKSLDNILSTGSKLKIIRLFISRKNEFRASGRQVAKLINMTAPAAHAALKELENHGLLKRKIIGKQHIYGLDENSEMVKQVLKPMFQNEGSLIASEKNEKTFITSRQSIACIKKSCF